MGVYAPSGLRLLRGCFLNVHISKMEQVPIQIDVLVF